MAERQYNHYVPKFYLANFSGNKKCISKCILSSGQIIRSASMKSTAGQEYLYGKDGVIEETFSQLEGRWDDIIKKIIQTEQIPGDIETFESLLHFFVLSENRTLAKANSNMEFWGELFRVTAKLLKENDKIHLSDEVINSIGAKCPIPNLQDLKNDILMVNLCADLRITLIKNISQLPFVTSDHPVVKYNQLFMSHNYRMPYAYDQQGIQLFYPISPSLCLVLFDPIPYRLHFFYDKKFIVRDPLVIRSINKLIAGYADQEIYFSPTTSDRTIKKILDQRIPDGLSPPAHSFPVGDRYFIVNSNPSYLHRISLPLFTVEKHFREMSFSFYPPPMRPHAEKCTEHNRCV